MCRLLLMGMGLLLATSSQGQDLLTGRRYIVSKVTTMRFNSITHRYSNFGARPVYYLVAPIASGLRVCLLNTYSGTSEPSVANVICHITNLKYLRHEYETGTLTEEYLGFYKTITVDELPLLPGLPNPGVVDVDWEVKSDGTAMLHLHWYFGPKAKTGGFLGQSYLEYTLYCEPIN